MNLPADPDLWRWQCRWCKVFIRTRHYDMTLALAKRHSWTEHRVACEAFPRQCAFDARIRGHVMLVTYED
jgi:hypothetical protein